MNLLDSLYYLIFVSIRRTSKLDEALIAWRAALTLGFVVGCHIMALVYFAAGLMGYRTIHSWLFLLVYATALGTQQIRYDRNKRYLKVLEHYGQPKERLSWGSAAVMVGLVIVEPICVLYLAISYMQGSLFLWLGL